MEEDGVQDAWVVVSCCLEQSSSTTIPLTTSLMLDLSADSSTVNSGGLRPSILTIACCSVLLDVLAQRPRRD